MYHLKRLAALILLLLLQQSLWSQEAEKKAPKIQIRHELGLNVTSMINRVVRSGVDSINENPYLLTYRVCMGRWGFRLGAGGSYQYNKSSEAGFRDFESTRKFSWDARAGLDYRTRFGRHFAGNFGLDFVGQQFMIKETNDSGFDVIEEIDQFTGWGGGPVVGLSWWFTPYLGLYTEASFYFLAGQKESGRTFKNFPELDDEVRTEDTNNVRTILPASIFLTYRF